MTNEEKEAIDWLKDELDGEKKSHKNCNYSYKGVTGLYGNNEVEIALKLIEKQQKEIERKDKVFDDCKYTIIEYVKVAQKTMEKLETMIEIEKDIINQFDKLLKGEIE